MARWLSEIDSEGFTTLPPEVQRKLGVGPGSTLTWIEDGDRWIVRPKGKYTSKDIHKALFPDGPPKRRTIEEMDEGIRRYMREKYSRSKD